VDWAPVYQVWGPILVIAVVLLVRARRIGKERALKLQTIWVLPVLVTAVTAVLFISLPPPPIGWFALAAGGAIGAALGWHRGKMMALRIDRETGILWQTPSFASFLLIVAVIALRLVVKDVFGGDPTRPGFAHWAVALTDLLMGVAVGVIVFTRVELLLRARKLVRSSG
jgi:hypothetical protein